MTALLNTLELRLVAALESGRDPTSSGRAIPAGMLRRSVQNAPLRDPDYPMAGMDRAYEFEWLTISDDPDAPTNPFDNVSLRTVRLALNVGYVYGVNASGSVSVWGSEDKTVTVLHARKRALSDAETIYRALGYGPIVTGSIATGLSLVECVRDGASRIEDLGGGRLLCVTEYRIILEVANSQPFTP